MADGSFSRDAFAGLDQLVASALQDSAARIRPLDLADGRRVWLKRTETLSGRMRLLKGNAQKGLERDCTGLRLLGAAGLPVAPTLLQGPNFFVTPDLGTTLEAMLRDAEAPRGRLEAVFAAAGAALAQMHRRGFCHGRPTLRDICWDGEAVHLIDLERFSSQRTGPKAYAGDLLILLHNILTVDRAASGLAGVLTAAYRAEGPAPAMDELRRQARALGWLIPVTAPLRRLKPRSRELNAVPPTLRFIGRST